MKYFAVREASSPLMVGLIITNFFQDIGVYSYFGAVTYKWPKPFIR